MYRLVDRTPVKTVPVRHLDEQYETNTRIPVIRPVPEQTYPTPWTPDNTTGTHVRKSTRRPDLYTVNEPPNSPSRVSSNRPSSRQSGTRPEGVTRRPTFTPTTLSQRMTRPGHNVDYDPEIRRPYTTLLLPRDHDLSTSPMTGRLLPREVSTETRVLPSHDVVEPSVTHSHPHTSRVKHKD